MTRPNRRAFIGSSSSLLGLAEISNFSRLHADEGQPLDVSMTSDIAPLVRLMETTPREKSVGMMIGELRKGTTRYQFVAAMFLAAGRMKVSPHHVSMINSARHLSAEMEPNRGCVT